jgi:hypothetical protein
MPYEWVTTIGTDEQVALADAEEARLKESMRRRKDAIAAGETVESWMHKA